MAKARLAVLAPWPTAFRRKILVAGVDANMMMMIDVFYCETRSQKVVVIAFWSFGECNAKRRHSLPLFPSASRAVGKGEEWNHECGGRF